MNLGLRGKLIVVGGGCGGIGHVVCEALRKEGAEVVVADLKAKAGVNLANPQEVRRFFAGLRKTQKKLYGYCSLVYGGGGESGILTASPQEIQCELNGTLLAAVYPIQEAIRWMKETGGGHIVIVSSVNSILGLNEFGYDIAKGALNRIAPDIAASCGQYGIYAVTLCPGTVVGTSSWEGQEKVLKKIASTIPDGKLATALEVANVIAFLLSPYAAMFSGSTLIADRGWHLRPMDWKK